MSRAVPGRWLALPTMRAPATRRVGTRSGTQRPATRPMTRALPPGRRPAVRPNRRLSWFQARCPARCHRTAIPTPSPYPPPLAFTGGTGAYFRVWIVNLLLCCVTLGLYTPWARQRTAQYFYRHTLVAGSPLEFAGRPRGLVLGFVLLLLLWLLLMLALASGILWSAWLHQMLRWIPIFDLRIKGDELPWLFRAAEWIPTFGIFASIGHKSMAVPVLAGAALLPWVWGSAMRFRLGATRWRGLRLQFASHWREIYGGSGLLWVLA